MGAMFRSEKMALAQLFIQPEAAYFAISEMGETGCVQFRDLNAEVNVFQRKFVNEVRRCDEMERKLRFVESEVRKDNVRIPDVVDLPKAPNPREIIDLEGNEYYKTVFVAFFQGEQLKSRIKKVCAGFHASLYPCPSTQQERVEMLQGVRTRLEDLTMVLNQTEDHRQRVLVNVAKELQNWSVMVWKMKAIYHTLNLFNMDVTKKCFIGECWVPCDDIPNVQKALADGSSACGSSIPSFLNIIDTNEPPPTFNRTNKFTRGFQNLIDAYGVASYRECNPALYTIITFPFLFATMFGDCGHALLMTFYGLYLVLNEKKIAAQKNKSEIYSIFFGGRYIILLMGIFSFYTGFVYNDIFSKSMNIFGTSWKVNVTALGANFSDDHGHEGAEVQFTPRDNFWGTPYFIGVDPAWQVSKNKIIFLNSFKMKLSIIFGVTHMIFGVVVSTFNFVHFRKYSSIVLEFLPQVLLLIFLFLWMVVMMFMKWAMYSGTYDGIDTKHGSSCAPSVLIYFINMMLFKETVVDPSCDQYMFESQGTVQMVLLFGALICIPWMLLGKPLYIKCTRKNGKSEQLVNGKSNGDINQGMEMNEVTQVTPENGSDATTAVINATPAAHHESTHHEEEEPMSEIWVHQAIHTIEYVLSTISHTASYLRLWALSLAHAQLSEVLWNMVLQMGLKAEGFVGCVYVYIFFGVWALFTIAILVLMEGLSAFLHTLRLHWVEFMSKFYSGLGYAFEPFSFKAILNAQEEGEE
ncbi:V-type proton ATPase 116 kDa subunit a 1 isoform X2 [Cylas formicarius]|uniref:V-type proton ATPase 116 kDa subunit a 1 isoform X2 n=1 Tax=Cylas formicarius TaxID=197179 RepID=UPI0029588BE3|nr:V-type proton ATPase 116 kDa subunit a 1 isoform X2 [Cylas formicarius]